MNEHVAAPEDFDRIRDDPRFLGICQLARMVNSIRELDELARDAGADRERRRAVCFHLCGALAFESLTKLCVHIGKDWATDEVYRDGIGALVASDEVREAQDRYLKPLRNKAVFHSDQDLLRDGLASLQRGVSFRFGFCRGDTTQDIFFDGPELLAWRSIFSSADTVEQFSLEYASAVGEVLRVVGALLESADQMILHALDLFGFVPISDSAP